MSPHRFEILVAPLLNSAYRTALCLADGRDDAEALLHEAMLRGFHRFEQQGPDGEVRWWLLRILLETFRERQRSRSREIRGDGSPSGAGASVDRLVGEIRRLSPSYRIVAALYFAEGLSCRDVAGVLRCSRAPVRRRVSQVRSALGAWAVAAEPTQNVLVASGVRQNQAPIQSRPHPQRPAQDRPGRFG